MLIKSRKAKLGQNFLNDNEIAREIIRIADVNSKDTIFEVGPGKGALTKELSKKAGLVVAIEKDETLIPCLKKKFSECRNVQLLSGDVLDFDFSSTVFGPGRYKIVANIPYYLTSFLIRKILSLENKPSLIVLMVQKEVAERIVSGPGEMNLLAISVQMIADPKIELMVGREKFTPQPKVDSAVISMRIKKNRLIVDEKTFFELLHAGFESKRKMLANNLSKKLKMPKEDICDIFKQIGIDIQARPQDLDLNSWIGLHKYFQHVSKK